MFHTATVMPIRSGPIILYNTPLIILVHVFTSLHRYSNILNSDQYSTILNSSADDKKVAVERGIDKQELDED